MRLLRKRGTGELFVWTESLSQRADMEEYLERAIRIGPSQTYPSEPVRTRTIEFYSSAGGIGDAVCALYVACGLANAGFKVLFHAKHREWLKVEHPGVQILPDEKCFDINDDYDGQLAAAYRGDITSRLEWYLRNLSRQFDIGDVKPARPAKVNKPPRPIAEPYIVLSPISAGRPRIYPMPHWRRIAKLLSPKYRVVVMAGEDGRQAVDDGFFGVPVEKRIGLPIDNALRYYANAKCVVANDSGPAHIAGLYEVPCVAVISQASGSFLFECSQTVTTVEADASCAKCYWQRTGGWDRVCEMGCSALYTIKPEEVCCEIERACAVSEATRNGNDLHTDGTARKPTGHDRVRARAKARTQGRAEA
jgi:hypothetical protein